MLTKKTSKQKSQESKFFLQSLPPQSVQTPRAVKMDLLASRRSLQSVGRTPNTTGASGS